MTDRRKPATEAGRRLLAAFDGHRLDRLALVYAIRAIEDELSGDLDQLATAIAKDWNGRAEAAAPRETPDQRLREALADAIALAGMLTDNLEGRGLLPYYVNVARTALPKLRAALAPEGEP